MPEEKRASYKRIYKVFKRLCASSIAVNVLVVELVGLGVDLTKIDLTKKRIRQFGYRSLLTVLVGPTLQGVGVVLYIFSLTAKIRIAFVELGARLTSRQLGIFNLGWLWMDYLFVEIVKSEYLMVIGGYWKRDLFI
jgi:hypothetical protein